MKFPLIIALTALLALSSCDSREQKLRKKELELNQKEQVLILKEKELQLREQQLSKNKLSDSLQLPQDSISKNNALPGNWSVEMICIETDCEGSAIGDTKNEIWEISYQNNTIIAKAKVKNKLVRVYTGEQKGRLFELSAEQSEGEISPAAKILVKLTLISSNRIEGRREILREGCRIIYSLELIKQ